MIELVRATREMPMMHLNKIAVLRTQLRELNIEYSALVRAKGGEDAFAKMDELRTRRLALMARIAEAAAAFTAGSLRPDVRRSSRAGRRHRLAAGAYLQ